MKSAKHLLETLEMALPLLNSIPDAEAARKPAPGKWSKKEILGHLIDSACNNQQKFVRTLRAPGGHLDFIGYAQDEWVAAQGYQTAPWPQIIDLWRAYNIHLAHVIAQADPSKLSNTITIEGSGPFRLDFIMADYVEHLKHHLKAILPEAGLESAFANVYNA